MISKACGYAIRGIVLLSLEKNQDRKLSINEISTLIGVPQPFMGKIFQDLVKKGFIGSTKGPNGGFFALKNTSETSVHQIIDAIDGLGVLNKCILGFSNCDANNPCPLHDDFDNYRDVSFKIFAKKKIGDLVSSVHLQESVLLN